MVVETKDGTGKSGEQWEGDDEGSLSIEKAIYKRSRWVRRVPVQADGLCGDALTSSVSLSLVQIKNLAYGGTN